MGNSSIIDIELALMVLSRHTANRAVQCASGPLERSSYAILGQLGDHGAVRMGALARQVGLDPSTISRQVRLVVDRGFARRLRAERDRRGTVIEITDSGSAVLREARHLERTNLERVMVGWSETDRAKLSMDLRRLNGDLAD